MLTALSNKPAATTSQKNQVLKTGPPKRGVQPASSRFKKSNSQQLLFNAESDVLSRRDGIPSVIHQLRQTYARSSHKLSSAVPIKQSGAALVIVTHDTRLKDMIDNKITIS